MTEAEWLARQLPLTGEHEIHSTGCSPELLGAELRVVPTVSCPWAEVESPEGSRVAYCDVAYCTGPEQCVERENGRCEGSAYPARCFYPGVEPERCVTNADCTRLTSGRCEPERGDDFYCYPTGECVSLSESLCSYAPEPCASDADCTSVPGGECISPIEYTRCVYDECRADASCAAGERCGCFRCVAANCSSDADCEGGVCQLWDVCGRAQSFECTSDADECSPTEFLCQCGYANGRFECGRYHCR